MMQSKLRWLVPVVALTLNSGIGFSNPRVPTKTASKTPGKTTAAKSGSVGKKGFAITQISKGSDVIRAPFVPGSVTSNHDPFDHESHIVMTQITGKNVLGTLYRNVQISENNSRSLFEKNVGKSLPIGSGGFDKGVPTVLVEYRQNNPPGRWQAISGTVVIDAYRRNSTLTEIVTFRLINARFTPFFQGKGQFSLSLSGTSSGARNPD